MGNWEGGGDYSAVSILDDGTSEIIEADDCYIYIQDMILVAKCFDRTFRFIGAFKVRSVKVINDED